MGDSTGIEWTDATWNPVRGCSRVSEGCRNCYAERVAGRFSGPGQPYEGLIKTVARKRVRRRDLASGDVELKLEVVSTSRWNGTVRLVPEHLADPLRWRRPRRIFVNSMSDLFHEALPDEAIAAVFGIMVAAAKRGHTFQVLTKRASRLPAWFEHIRQEGKRRGIGPAAVCVRAAAAELERAGEAVWSAFAFEQERWLPKWPVPNVWLGVSAEDQAAADERVPLLLRTPAAVRFVSYEPALGPVYFDAIQIPDERAGLRFSALRRHHDDRFGSSDVTLDWIIAGAESGPGARPAELGWYRSVRDQCAAAGVAFFLKQAASTCEYAAGDYGGVAIEPGPRSKTKGRIVTAPLLDGVQHLAFPEARHA